MALDLQKIRPQFPALTKPVIFLDNPGGTQIARKSLKRIHDYLVDCNANHGGVFATSVQSDQLIQSTREAAADFLCAAQADEIVFGPNMTTLTFGVSRALGLTFNAGDTLVVTRLDHDANISPWLRVAEDRGCRIRWVDFNPVDCTLDLDDYQRALEEKPKLVAFGYASNAVGTVNPAVKLTRMAHEAGALVYIDAVQYAPHGPIDVRQIGCDFLVCSAYKFFGPHLGILYGRYELLDALKAYRVRPAPAEPPGKFETGTGTFENIAGLLGALDYLEWVGRNYGAEHSGLFEGQYSGRRRLYKQAMAAVRSYEVELSRAMLDNLQEVPGLKLYGMHDNRKLEQRVPTFSFTLQGRTPLQTAEYLAQAGINVWNGNFYALAVTERLGLEAQGGLVRVGAVHYNTQVEVQQLGEALRSFQARRSESGF